jgi:acetyltransferase-like isoleucine patch superfamily enzyme
MREALKRAAHLLATIAILPQLASFTLRSSIMGRDRAIEGSTQALSLIPGILGQYLRRAFLGRVLAGGCARTATIEFGVIFSQAGSRIDEHAYIGPRCHIGLVHLERDVLVADGVHIPSGAHTHGTESGIPVRNQEGRRTLVRIGAGTWIGSNAVVMADIGSDTIVGAGAVVSRPLPGGVVAGGVPARVIRERTPAGGAAT